MNRLQNIVIAGYGRIGKSYGRIISDSSQFKLTGIIDPNLKEIDGINIWSSVDALAKHDAVKDIDGFIVCTPTTNHFDMVNSLAQFGKPILVEKPLTESVESALLLAKEFKSSGIPLYVSKPERFNPAVQKLVEVLRSGWLGQPIHYAITRVGGYPSDSLRGSGVILDLAVHDFDLLQFVHGNFKVRSSICHQTTANGAVDTAEVLLVNNQGISASVHVNWITPVKVRTLKVTGTKGVLFLDFILQTCDLFGGEFSSRIASPELSFKSVQQEYQNVDKMTFGIVKSEPLKEQLLSFGKAIVGEKTLLCTATEAADIIRLTQMAIDMGDGGRSVLSEVWL